MGKNSYMPDSKAAQVAWANNLVEVVQPEAANYGVPAPTMTAFAAINDTLQAAWTASQNEATRTKATVREREVALENMKKAARLIVLLIQGTATVTDGMLIRAGLTVRKTKPTPKPAPTAAPLLEIVKISGRVATLRLRGGDGRGRPAGAVSATVLTSEGPTRPMTIDDLRFTMNTTQTTVNVTFPPSTTGGTAWVTAFWNGSRGEVGAAAQPQELFLPPGGVIQSESKATMKISKAA